jgi:hypothetical protein
MARIAFAAITAGTCAFALARHRPYALCLLASGPFLYALQRGQWGPLLVAMAFFPLLGTVAAAKPSIGLATFAYRPSRTALLGVGTLGLLSLLIMPTWPARWLAELRDARHFLAPITLPGGFLLLLGIIRWRAPEGRLIAVLGCVPQTPALYELFPLALVPQTWRRALVLTICFNVLYLVTIALHPRPPALPSGIAADFHAPYWLRSLVLGYLPALAMALLPPRQKEVE